MPSDSDPITVTKKTDDLSTILIDTIGGIKYKFIFIMFIVFLALQSDTFIEKILSKFDSATYAGFATTWGVVIQGIILCSMMILVDGLIAQNVI